MRKLRFAAEGKGKSCGARVIYYLYDETLPLYTLTAHGKGERDNFSLDQKKAVAAFAQALKAMARS